MANVTLRKARYRRYHLKKTFGLTVAAFDAIVAGQGGHCALCPSKNRLCVDHDHKTGRIRGVLCTVCNRAIAALGDSEEGLRRALAYFNG